MRAFWRTDKRKAWSYFYPDCKTCYNARRRRFRKLSLEEGRAIAWEEDYQKIIQRTLTLVRDDRPIPDSNPALDLAVVAACWSQCVRAGQPAVRRMLKKVVDSCRGRAGIRLRNAALACLEGTGDLAMVAAELGEVVGLAVAS